MGVATDDASLAAAVETASTRGARFFADPAVYVERFVPHARHIEVQVVADGSRVVHLFERECSVQRRHQKVLVETPSPALDDALRERMTSAAVAAMRSIGYRGLGTVECVITPDGDVLLPGGERASAGRTSHHRGDVQRRGPGRTAAPDRRR